MTKATVEIDLRDIEDDIIDYVEHNKEDFRYIFEDDIMDYVKDNKEDFRHIFEIDIKFLFQNIADKSIVFELQNSPVYEYKFKNLSEKLVSIINRLSEK